MKWLIAYLKKMGVDLPYEGIGIYWLIAFSAGLMAVIGVGLLLIAALMGVFLRW